jgi:hypothetical protein
VAFVPRSHAQFARLSKQLTTTDSTVGILICERLVRHSDGLSVSGYYLQGTDQSAPKSTLIAVTAAADGTPDVDHLCRDAGEIVAALNCCYA